jgi:hypothetical protein
VRGSAEWLAAQKVNVEANREGGVLADMGECILKARHRHHERGAVDDSVFETLQDPEIN